MEGYTVCYPATGSAYLELPSGRRIGIPSGGIDEPASPPAEGGDKTPAPPEKLSWDKIDWETVQLDKRNLPKPILSMVGDIVAKERKTLQAQLEATRGELSTATQSQQQLETQISDLQQAIEALKSPPPDDDGEPKIPAAFARHPDLKQVWLDLTSEKKTARETADALKAELADAKKQLESISSTAEQERKQRTETEERLRNLRRDKEVLGVLSTLNVIDPRRELALYASRAEYDATTDSFVYRNADGDLVSLVDGIKAELPEYVLRPDVRNGGSGSHGGQGAGGTRPETPHDLRARKAQEHAALRDKVARGERLHPNEQTKMLQLGRELKTLGASA